MGAELWAALGAFAAALVTLIGILVALRKTKAEARKLDAQAGRIEWQTLHDEILRLDGLTKALRAEMDALKIAAAEEKSELERENRTLRSKVARLEARIRAMEEIFRIGPIPPEMQAELDKLKTIE